MCASMKPYHPVSVQRICARTNIFHLILWMVTVTMAKVVNFPLFFLHPSAKCILLSTSHVETLIMCGEPCRWLIGSHCCIAMYCVISLHFHSHMFGPFDDFIRNIEPIAAGWRSTTYIVRLYVDTRTSYIDVNFLCLWQTSPSIYTMSST